MTHNGMFSEQHEIVRPDPITLDPSLQLLYELMNNPACKCRQTCLVSLLNDSVGQASLVILMEDYNNLPMQERPLFFNCYAQEDDSAQPYVFVSDDRSEAIAIPLCFKSTASIFQLSRTDQEKWFISASGRRNLTTQRLHSQLLCATAQFLRTGPHPTSMGQPLTKINWTHKAFLKFDRSRDHLQELMKKLGMHPWKGYLTYAVKYQRNDEDVLDTVPPPAQIYEVLLSQLGGCHITLTEAQHLLLQKLAKLAPTQATSSKWEKVSKISSQRSQLEGKPTNKYQVHYMSLKESNTLMGTYQHYLKRRCESMEWEKWKLLINEITCAIQSAISSVARDEKSLGDTHTSILYSAAHALQNPHYDFKKEVLDKNGENMYLGFTPLTEDGMFLQVWTEEGNGKVVYIPLGEFLILPSKTMHAGGFCSRALTGNLRLHFYFYLNNVPAEPHNTNVYSDSLGEFHDRYHNSDGLMNGKALTNLFAQGIE